MKKVLSILAASVMTVSALTGAMTASASEVATGQCGDNVTWTLDSEGVLTISGEGKISSEQAKVYGKCSCWGYYEYKDSIKEVVFEEGITGIGKCAFGDEIIPVATPDFPTAVFPNMHKVTFPSTLTEIGDFAFNGCSLEGELNLPAALSSLGQQAFACTNITSINSLNEDMILGGTVFAYCQSLTEVGIPKGCTYYRNGEINAARANKLFRSCKGLKRVILEEGATFSEGMFTDCKALEEVIIKSKNLESIPKSANNPFYEMKTGVSLMPSGTSYADRLTYKVHRGTLTEGTLRSFQIPSENIIYFPYSTHLEKAIALAESKEAGKYTDVSINALTKAIADAKAVLENINATQEDVNYAVTAVNNAIRKLEEKPTLTEPSKEPSSNQTKPTAATPKAVTPTKITRNAGVVAKEKKAASKVMKQAKLNSLRIKSKGKKINVSWRKVKKAKGYEVQVSAKKNFKKVIFKKDLKKTKLTIKNMKIRSKKIYFVRVRAYATYKDINNNTIKVYSKWNKQLRKVKVK